jgi:sugar phosphate permease
VAELDPAKAAELRVWRAKILASTWMAYAGLYFCRKPFYVAKLTLAHDLHLETSQLGEIGTAYLVAYTIGQFLAAGLGQRRGARVVLLGGMAVSIGCNVAFAFANNYWTLFTFMFVNGLAQATGWPSVVGTIGRWTRRAERGTLMGFWGTCYQLGGVAATSWAGFWLARQGTKGAFLAASMVLFAAWVVVALWQRNRPEDVGLPPVEEQTEEEVEADAAADRGEGPSPWTRPLIINLALIGVFYFGVKFIRYALWSWAPFLLESRFGMAADEAGYLSTLFDLAGFAGVVFAGIVSDRFFNGHRTLPSFLMLIGMMLGCAALGILGPLGIGWFGASLALIGFMLFGPDSLLSGAGAVDLGSPRMAVAVAGIINGMGSAGAVVQELVVARLLDDAGNSMGPVFAVLWGASALSISALAVVLWRNKRGSADL